MLRKDELVMVFKEEMDHTGEIRQESVPRFLTIPET